MTIDSAVTELMVGLLDAFEATEEGIPALPLEQRSEVVTLLTRVFTDPHFFSAYVAALQADIDRRGRPFGLRMLTLNAPDIPDGRIRDEGCAGLPDAVLVDLATSPSALTAVEEFLYAPGATLTDWMMPPDHLGPEHDAD